MTEHGCENGSGTAWSAAAVVAAVRALLARSTAVSPGFTFDGVWSELGDLVIAFRWWRDPNGYVVRLPLPEEMPSESLWTGLPVVSAVEWAHDVAGLLAEELDTGAVRRARRRRRDGAVELDWGDTPHPCPTGYYCGEVVLPATASRWAVGSRADFGRSLAAAGLDVSTPRRQYRQRRLLTWRQLWIDTSAPEPVGHVSAAWHSTLSRTATLDVLQVLPGVLGDAVPYLARMAVHDAAEAGAERVEATCAQHRLADAGLYQEHPGGPFVVDTTCLD